MGVHDRNSPLANFIYELDRSTAREQGIEKPVPLRAALPQANRESQVRFAAQKGKLTIP